MVKANRKFKLEPDYAIPPGETLEETMFSLGLSQRDLADRTGLTVQTLNRIFKGEQPISYETANRLELVTGIAASFWNNLEANYREQLAKLAQARELEADLSWLKTIPVKDLVRRGAIAEHTDRIQLFLDVLRFYGVSSVETWRKVWERPAAAARRSQVFTSSPGPTSAWLRLGQLQARDIDCKPYDKKQFQECLIAIRGLTLLPPTQFMPKMRALCAASGVALVFVPEIKGTRWSGAAEWLTPNKAMILLSLRGKFEDQFWFSFFHEACHILHDSKKETFIDDPGSDYAADPAERKADEFAADLLIPKKHNRAIAALKSTAQVEDLAAKLNISPGIVVGRFQYLTRSFDRFNGLKRKLEFDEPSQGTE